VDSGHRTPDPTVQTSWSKPFDHREVQGRSNIQMSFKYPAFFTCRRRSSGRGSQHLASEGRLLPSALSPPSFCCIRRALAHSECRDGDTAPCPGNSSACAWRISAAQRPLHRERARTHLCLSPLWQDQSTSSVFISSSTIIGWTSPSWSRPSVTTRVHMSSSVSLVPQFSENPPNGHLYRMHGMSLSTLTRQCRVWL